MRTAASAWRRRPDAIHSEHWLRGRDAQLAVALGLPVAEKLRQRPPRGGGRAVRTDAASAPAAVVTPVEKMEVLLAQLAARRLSVGADSI